MYRLYGVPPGIPAVGTAVGKPLLEKTVSLANPCSEKAVPPPVISIFAYVLINTLSNVNGPPVVMPAPDGFHVTSMGAAALANDAPVNNNAANGAAKYFLSCMVFPFTGKVVVIWP